jgi:hypothetical protein
VSPILNVSNLIGRPDVLAVGTVVKQTIRASRELTIL